MVLHSRAGGPGTSSPTPGRGPHHQPGSPARRLKRNKESTRLPSSPALLPAPWKDAQRPSLENNLGTAWALEIKHACPSQAPDLSPQPTFPLW